MHFLLLESNPDDVQLLIPKLEGLGTDVEIDVSRNEAEFRSLLQKKAYSLIIADYDIPGWTGLDAIRYVRSSSILTPFVLVTGSLGDDLAVECIKAGASDYLLKDNLDRLPLVAQRVVDEQHLECERKRAADDLKHSEEQYRLLFDSNPHPMWVFDAETLQFLAVNDTAVMNYGYSRAEFLSMKITDIRPPDDVAKLLEHYEEVRNCPASFLTRWKHRKRDGTVFDVEITASALTFHDRPARLVLAHDVSDRIKAESALRESTQRYRAIVEGSPLGIFQSDWDGHMLMANPALVNILGYEDRNEVLSLNLATDIYIDPNERKSNIESCALACGDPVHFESQWKRKDGRPITVHLCGRGAPNREGRAYFEVFVEDITEHRSLERQFRHAQKMEAVGRLAGGVAHDFNNLLTVITSFAQLLPEFSSDPEKVKSYARQIHNAGNRAAAVTRQLLAFSRKQVQDLQRIDLNHLITDFCRLLPRVIGEDIEVSTRLAKEPCLIDADRGQIEQVIMNLAVNARDAMPRGGKLEIETAITELDEQYGWRHEAHVPSGFYVTLVISDTGCGMTPDTQARIFEPFYTTKAAGEGTGLGLATVYGIVKQSNGYIWVYSEIQKGATFKIYLPRAIGKASSHDAEKERDVVSHGNETILLTEDEDLLRAANREFLEARGYKVLLATGAEEALQICARHSGEIHLLLTDVIMPGMSGPDLANQVLQLRPGVRVLYVSGYTDTMIDPRVKSEGAGFLEKPYSLEVLERKVRSLLDS